MALPPPPEEFVEKPKKEKKAPPLPPAPPAEDYVINKSLPGFNVPGKDDSMSPRAYASLFSSPDQELEFYQKRYGNSYDFKHGGLTEGLLYRPKGAAEWAEIDPINPFRGGNPIRETYEDAKEVIAPIAESVVQGAGLTAGTAAGLGTVAGTGGVGVVPAASMPYLGVAGASALANTAKQGIRSALLPEDEAQLSGKELAKETALGPVYHVAGEKIINPALKYAGQKIKAVPEAIGKVVEKGKNYFRSDDAIEEISKGRTDAFLKKVETSRDEIVGFLTGQDVKDEKITEWAKNLTEFVMRDRDIDPKLVEKIATSAVSRQGGGKPISRENLNKLMSRVADVAYPEMATEVIPKTGKWAANVSPPTVAIPKYKNIIKAKEYISGLHSKLSGKADYEPQLLKQIQDSKAELEPAFNKGYGYLLENLKGVTINSADRASMLKDANVIKSKLTNPQAIKAFDEIWDNGIATADLSTLLQAKKTLADKKRTIDRSGQKELGEFYKFIKKNLQEQLNRVDKNVDGQLPLFDTKAWLQENTDVESILPIISSKNKDDKIGLGDFFEALENSYGTFNESINLLSRATAAGTKGGTATSSALAPPKRGVIEKAVKAQEQPPMAKTSVHDAIGAISSIEADRRTRALIDKFKVINPDGSIDIDPLKLEKIVDSQEYSQLLEYLKASGKNEDYFKMSMLRNMFTNPRNFLTEKPIDSLKFDVRSYGSKPVSTFFKASASDIGDVGAKALHTLGTQPKMTAAQILAMKLAERKTPSVRRITDSIGGK